MKIKFGAIVTDGRNKIGGHVASKNKAGNYLKTKSSPTNPNTSFQSAVRQNFGSLAQSWRGLTQAQRDSWISGAPSFPYTDIFGDTKILSGFGLFMQLNSNLLAAGVSTIDTCPSPVTVEAISITSAAYEVGTSFGLAFSPATVPANHRIIISGTPALGQGRAFSKSQLRQFDMAVAGGTSPEEILTSYQNRFAAIVNGDNFYIGAHTVHLLTGQVSPLSVIKATEA